MQNHSIFRLALVACSAVLLIACAGPNPPPNPRQLQLTEGVRDLLKSDPDITLADSRIHCEQRRQVGSNFRARICMLSEEYDATRDDSLRDVFRSDERRGTGMGAKGEG